MSNTAKLESTPLLSNFSKRGLLVAFVLVAILFAHAGTIQNLLFRWSESGDYSSGYFIPVISGWLLWMRRDAIIANAQEGSWLGVVVLLISALGLVAGELTYIYLLNHLSLILALAGLVLCIGGADLLRVCLVPLFFLLFMIPLPYFVGTTLTWQLQIIASQTGAYFISWFGIPVFLQGNIIDLGAYQLGVDEACSGLRYLMPLISIGFLAAYMFRGPLWQRVTLFMLVFPLAIVLNGLRIAFVAVLYEFFGIPPGNEFTHFMEGWVVFIGCLGALYLVMLAFSRLTPMSGALLQLPVFDRPRAKRRKAQDSKPLFVASVLCVVTAVAVLLGLQQTVSAPAREPLAQLPYEFDSSWQARTQQLDAATEEVLGADDYLLADFTNSDGDRVNLYIAYLDSQRDGRSWHSPRQCMPGGGWSITALTRHEVMPGSSSLFRFKSGHYRARGNTPVGVLLVPTTRAKNCR